MRDKIAVITGSTQGLGESIARKLIADGLHGLVICGRNTENGNRLEEEFNELGCKTIYVQTDLANIADCQKIVDVASREFDQVDILVNSAGTTERGSLLETTPELFDHIFAVNTRAPFFLMQGIAKIMLANKTPGTMLNIISMSSHGGQPFIAAYSGSKAALVALTKNAAFALMRHHIRVNGLNIGWMDSPGEHFIQKKHHNADDTWLEEAEKKQPFGRLIKPAEVAEVAAFIVSDKSGMLTGAIIDYDQSVLGTYNSPPQP